MPAAAAGPSDATAAGAAHGTRVTLAELVALRASIGAPHWRRASVARPAPAGAHLGSGGGRGMEFADSRPYQAGDDVRAIDWRQTARRGKPFTKLFHEERERPVWLLCDLGPSMRFGSRVAFKSVLAARAAALLAWQAAAAGDRVGGGAFGIGDGTALAGAAGDAARPALAKGVRGPGSPAGRAGQDNAATSDAIQPARRGRDGVLTLLRLLADADRDGDADAAAANAAAAANTDAANDGDADAAADAAAAAAGALATLCARQRPGGRLVVLSDFAALDGAAEPVHAALRALARHHSIALVHIVDRLEVAPPPPGRYAFAGPDGTRWLDLADPATRAAWGAPYRARRAALAELAGALGATQLELFTDQPAERVLGLGSNDPLRALPRPRTAK